MDTGINNIKEFAEFISYCVTIITLIAVWFAYILSKRQIHFSTMEKCIKDFREIELKISSSTDKTLANQYIELVNEEFFYCENNYLPLEVSIEWIDGMIDYLPFILPNDHFQKSLVFPQFESIDSVHKHLQNYPRVIKAIKLKKNILFSNIHLTVQNESDRKLRKHERDRLILLIFKNLNISIKDKLLLKRKISCR